MATEVTESTEELYIGEMYGRKLVHFWEDRLDRRVGPRTD